MIYFDAASSTKTDAAVSRCFLEVNERFFANSSSAHGLGREASRALESYRKELLTLFGLEKTHEVTFLSSATEANNLAIKGVCLSAYHKRGNKIITSAVEHPSVLEVFHHLRDQYGFEVVELPVNEKGFVDPKTLEEAMDNQTILVSIMGVNNETGAINDLETLGTIVHRYPKAFFHSDLTQAIGKIDVPYGAIDMFSYSGHKIHGIKGSGALIYKKAIRLSPQMLGGGQEAGMRSGTVSVPLCASLVEATSLALSKEKESLRKVRILWDALDSKMSLLDVTVNSYKEGSPYVFNFSLNHHKASVIVEALSEKGIYVSSASACSSRIDHASHVLTAMGLSHDLSGNAIRLSFDESNSLEQIDEFVYVMEHLLKEVHQR